jgi:hypothetical protein
MHPTIISMAHMAWKLFLRKAKAMILRERKLKCSLTSSTQLLLRMSRKVLLQSARLTKNRLLVNCPLRLSRRVSSLSPLIFSEELTIRIARPSKKFRGANLNIEVTRVLKPIQYAPTPVSPYREITFISAERVTSRGREYRVQLREYWVSELDLPDIEEIRRKQIRVYGKPWVVLPPT